ncbi:hypothetical protein C8Q77DRAFT_1110310 [Trametes polyzona]|nr:hypothetical protein C8Q77DRAFT_1110310 [Trametes polyzona]
MRFFAIALAFFAGSLVHAAPASELVARQIGDLQCNIDRLSIVAALAATQGTLKSLAKDLSSDAASAAEVQTAQSSVSGAEAAIGVIAKALVTGQSAPAEARTQVQGNLTAAHDALTSIKASGSSGNTLKLALLELGAAQAAGNGVVKNCK